MLLKLIQCRVSDDTRKSFSEAQTHWRALGCCAGFGGQFGGWSAADSNLAVIVGVWSDESAYARFMRDVHDSIFEGHGQKGTYQSIDVSLWHEMFPISGAFPSIVSAVGSAGAVRLARCRLLPDREGHFLDAQRNIWNPGMAGAGGMLGGAFSRSTTQPNEFLVCTLWESLDAHQHYKNGPFSGLRRRAEVETDCDDLRGWVVTTESAWRVSPIGGVESEW